MQAKVKNVLAFNPASFNVFVNEKGIYIVSTILEPLIKGQFIRFNRNQQFPDSDRISDLTDLSFQDDMIVLSLDRFQGMGATEICLLNTSLNEREKIKQFVELGKKMG
ncbi:MAG: hypothetical protein IAF38_17410 [Bacteroidia bacterium]|nr:hypothetical protein [Bacteroidia bacterium]